MAQTLTVFPAFPSPILAGSDKILAQNMSVVSNLNNQELLGLSVLSKIYSLKYHGGTDYSTNHKQMRIDAQSFIGTAYGNLDLPARRWSPAQAVIDWNAAKLGAVISSDVSALVLNMAGIAMTNESDLYMFYLFLCYKLSLLT